MPGYDAREVMECYDRTAQEYAAQYLDELDHKPFDRSILDRFSSMLPEGSRVFDYGCGSGQTTRHLRERKRHRLLGLDFSAQALRLARRNFPDIEFVVDDMLCSCAAGGSAHGILAFYAIVHFTPAEVERVLGEWRRVLKPGGLLLFSFHVGEGPLRVDDFLGVRGAKATWQFLDPDRVLDLAGRAGFEAEEVVIRHPYKGREHESRRAYFLLRRDRDG
jgi:SAM-dependent methyltransferase